MASESAASPRFFVLEKDETFSRYDADAETVDPVNLGDAPLCPRCGDPLGMLTWLPPYRAQLVRYGEELGDFIEASGNDLLLSERFAQAFREEGLTGLEGFHPVEVVRVRRARRLPKHSHLPQYVVVRPCIGRAAVDLKRGTLQYAAPPTCEECRSGDLDAVFGFTLEPGTWQGEDVFFARGLPGVVTVSERFERFVTRHGFTNMRLTPTERHVWNPLRREPPLTLVKPGAP